MNEIEILSPAGKPECVTAAVANGCNAVYFGGRDFNARKAAENISDSELEQMIDYCHLHGVKAYIVVNTVYLESEFKTLLEFVEKAYAYGADAFIVCDMGLISILSRYFKDIELHASTQMSAHCLADVLYLESLGFKRVTIARETPLNNLSAALKETNLLTNRENEETLSKYPNEYNNTLAPDTINDIVNGTSCEIEIFTHGALCVCYSGRCLMSSFFGGRSGNRGDCAQPCRQNYTLYSPEDTEIKTGYLLSPKDECTLPLLPEFLRQGVSSLKIEGRMKSPEYCAVTALAYSDAVKAIKNGEAFDNKKYEKELLQVFNRGGSFTNGYYSSYSGFNMMSTDTPKSTGINTGQVLEYDKKSNMCTILLTENVIPGDGIEISGQGAYINKEAFAGSIINIKITGEIEKGDAVYKTYGKAVMDKARKSYESSTRKLQISAFICAKAGEAIKFVLKYNEVEAVVYADAPETAKNMPIEQDEFIRRLSKTGASTFEFIFEQADIGNDIFMPVAAINKLRRDAIDLFTNKFLKSFKRKIPQYRIPNYKPRYDNVKKLTVLVSNMQQLEAAAESDNAPYIIYAEISNELLDNLNHYAALCRKKGVTLYIALPFITIGTTRETQLIEKLESSDIGGYLVRTLGQFYLLSDTEKEIVLDYTFNIYNPHAAAAYPKDLIITASAELNADSLQCFGENTEAVVYGKIPMMITRQCPVGNYVGRDKEKTGPYCGLLGHDKSFYLVDRKGAKLTIKCFCDNCYAQIYTQKTHIIDEYHKLGVSRLRLQFTDEDGKHVKKIMSMYTNYTCE